VEWRPQVRAMCPTCGERPIDEGRALCGQCVDDIMAAYRESCWRERQAAERARHGCQQDDQSGE